MNFQEFSLYEKHLVRQYNTLIDLMERQAEKNELNAYAENEHTLQYIERKLEYLHDKFQKVGTFN